MLPLSPISNTTSRYLWLSRIYPHDLSIGKATSPSLMVRSPCLLPLKFHEFTVKTQKNRKCLLTSQFCTGHLAKRCVMLLVSYYYMLIICILMVIIICKFKSPCSYHLLARQSKLPANPNESSQLPT